MLVTVEGEPVNELQSIKDNRGNERIKLITEKLASWERTEDNLTVGDICDHCRFSGLGMMIS